MIDKGATDYDSGLYAACHEGQFELAHLMTGRRGL
jgi:hypothetical protein